MPRTRRLAVLATTAVLSVLDAQTGAQIEPGAGNWKTWILSSGRELRPGPPPDAAATRGELAWLRTFMGEATPQTIEQMRFWDAGPPQYRWIEMVTDRVNSGQISSLVAARYWGYLTTAMYDATVAAWDAKYTYNRQHPDQLDATIRPRLAYANSPSYPSEHAVVAGAASAVLSYLVPAEAALFTDLAEEAARSRLTAGAALPSDTIAGLSLGRAVAAKVIERAQSDNCCPPWTGTVPTGPGLWIGTNPGGVNDRHWRTFVLSSGAEVRAAPPPAFGSAQFQRELAEVKNFPRTFDTNYRAFFWQSPQGNASYWFNTASQKILEYRLDQNAPRAARVYALLGVGFYDTWVASQDGKFEYWAIRPNQADPTITTLYPTPNFPTYPSNASVLSTTSAEVMSYLFPSEAAVFRAKAAEAGLSRLWAGIHFRSDIEASEAMGRRVGQKLIERARTDGTQ
jgi:membrane-associated phospholipid phosphatase